MKTLSLSVFCHAYIWYLQFVLHRYDHTVSYVYIMANPVPLSWNHQGALKTLRCMVQQCPSCHWPWRKLNLICSLKGHIHPKKVTCRNLHKLSTECCHCYCCCISMNISTVGNCGGKSCSYKCQPSKQMASAWKTHMCHTFFLATSGLRCQIRHSAVLCSPEWLMQFALEGRDTNLPNGTSAMWIWYYRKRDLQSSCTYHLKSERGCLVISLRSIHKPALALQKTHVYTHIFPSP